MASQETNWNSCKNGFCGVSVLVPSPPSSNVGCLVPACNHSYLRNAGLKNKKKLPCLKRWQHDSPMLFFFVRTVQIVEFSTKF